MLRLNYHHQGAKTYIIKTDSNKIVLRMAVVQIVVKIYSF